ncbi:ATP-binding protein [Flavobacteriaceae bacterium GF1]
MKVKRIVVTGAPGTGKTVVVQELEKLGFHCYHEIIRDMTAKAKQTETKNKMVSNPLVFVDDPMEFNKTLLYGREKHFNESQDLREPMCFFDRGIPDVLAYMDFFGQKYPFDFEGLSRQKRYDAIFILPPWKAIYVSDNERLESFEEAEKLHHHLMETYTRFGYSPIIVPKASIRERTSFILDTLPK